ncbi:DUF2244 domain-containing protein [Rhodovulum sp. 12E13]|uniref:DUF2244 domain-containing protein n=1 Tax=Rhodovulum sp. 12E13 TaxID=2203891 RepID=UPI000E1451EE|nr:DUF2244 domain-containing protein [Rhodovulum sp. 12E13]RDC73652.1 DUF2244 domain-containing protein [Rhodovulum sp. 12E13]
MPYAWDEIGDAAPDPSGAAPAGGGPAGAGPRARLRLWPHRSMTNRGYALFVGATFALICVPMLSVLGSPVMWAILPFAMGTLGLTMWLIRMNDRSLLLTEELTLWDDRVALVRREPRRAERRWEANPHWVRVALHEEAGPVPNYVTLKGGDREVEIGAFLSADERAALFDDLTRRLSGTGLGAGVGGPATRP